MPDHVYLWHPIFVHFTLALLCTSALLFVAARLVPAQEWHRRLISGAELNLWGGTALTLLTVAFGWLAFSSVPHDDAAHPVMELHRALALATFGWFVAVALLSVWLRRRAPYPSIPFLLALGVGVAGLVGTGIRGGEHVYQHGVAVDSKPSSDTPAAAPAPPGHEGHHHHH